MTDYEKFFQEVISKFPKFQVGMRLEALNSIYDKSKILALCEKDKKNLTFKDFCENKKRGDILIVKETDGIKAICENIENGEIINISSMDLLENNIKIIKRLRNAKVK